MSDRDEAPGQHGDDGPADGRRAGGAHQDVGSVGEEALRLFGTLADLARQQSGGASDAVGGLAGQAAALAHELNEHVATDSAECRYCPVCRVVHAVRHTSPEVRAHLSVAASSLLQAAAGLLETAPPAGTSGGGARGRDVQRIDLDDADADGADGAGSDDVPGGGR
ncbi:hypothetical protein [Nocardioides sp. SYSU DS0651]|uniref:hypothetical protein n=1 Tax=Nocardioides sp. SYSU DS0651 TaxID=3415955 RepID=UPI003F4C064A